MTLTSNLLSANICKIYSIVPPKNQHPIFPSPTQHKRTQKNGYVLGL